MVAYTLCPLDALEAWRPFVPPGARCLLLLQGMPAYDEHARPIRIMDPRPRVLVLQAEEGEALVPDYRDLPGHGPEDVTVRPVPVLLDAGAIIGVAYAAVSNGPTAIADWQAASRGLQQQQPPQIDWEALKHILAGPGQAPAAAVG